jgi:hypothetical protein
MSLEPFSFRGVVVVGGVVVFLLVMRDTALDCQGTKRAALSRVWRIVKRSSNNKMYKIARVIV